MHGSQLHFPKLSLTVHCWVKTRSHHCDKNGTNKKNDSGVMNLCKFVFKSDCFMRVSELLFTFLHTVDIFGAFQLSVH